MPVMPATPRWLKAEAPRAAPVGVDRKQNAILGYVLAQEGPFKSKGRGEFDQDALREIVRLANAKPRGLKSRFAHPGLSDDGVGKYLGRARNARMDRVSVERSGKKVSLAAVRGDLFFDPTASKTPSGDLAGYLLDLAESDPDAVSSSLVLEVDEEYRVDEKNRRLEDAEGEPLPPLWRPKRLHASDIVDEGDAVDGLLSAGVDVDRLPDALQRRAWEMLDRLFSGAGRDVIEARCGAFLGRYLERRFGPAAPAAPAPTPKLDRFRTMFDEMALTVRKLRR